MTPRLRAILQDPDFWAMFFFSSETYFQPYAMPRYQYADLNAFETPDEVVGFPAGGGQSLQISLRDKYCGLELFPPGAAEEITIGWDWDDPEDAHPYVLRWEELDLLCRAAALLDPGLRHPGPMLALLGRFLLITDDDDVAVIHA